MFTQMGLRGKLFILTGFFLVSAAAGSIFSNLSFKRSAAKYDTLSSTDIPFLMATSRVSRLAKDTRVLAFGLMAIPDVDVRAMMVEDTKKAIDEKLKDCHSALSVAQSLHSDPKILEALTKTEAAQKNFEGSLSGYLTLLTNTTELKKPEGKGLIGSALADLDAKASEYEAALQAVLDESNQRSAQASIEASETAQVGIQINVLILAATLIVGVVATFLFSKSLMSLMDSIAGRVSHSTRTVSDKSAELSSTAQKLSQVATEQAAALAETAASVEQLQSMVEKNSENSRITADTSTRSRQEAERGQSAVAEMQKAVQDMNAANDRIMEQVMHSNDRISEVVAVIEEIGNKTKVINEIVFQTKLLSFNASVEAARAGEHGKGFAVVAEEVGALAQMSGNAAKEISHLLNQSIEKVGSIVTETKTKVSELVEEGKHTAKKGSETAEQCGEILGSIVTQVREVSSLAAEISRASQEQAKGVSEVSKATRQLDQATQMTAESAVHSEKLSSELLGESDALTTAVSRLNSAIHGVGTDHSSNLTTALPTAHSNASSDPKMHSRASSKSTSASKSTRSADLTLVPKKTAGSSAPSFKAKQPAQTTTQSQPSAFQSSSQASKEPTRSSSPTESAPMKQASGADFTPRHDDEGFEEL